MRSLVALVALAVGLSGCGATASGPATSSGPATTASTTPSVAPATTTMVETTSTTAAATTTTTTTTTVPFRELMITGTGKVYTLEESQAFGEFGPLLWNLVTTLNGTDRIEHGPGHEWVTWGPMWGGRLSGAYEFPETYGVTDLDAVDPEAVAAAIPTGKVIALREVRWSLDELDEYSDRLGEIARVLDTDRCGISWGVRPGEGLHITATVDQADQIASQWELQGLPPEVLRFEPFGCQVFWSGPLLVPADPTEFLPE